MAPDSAVGQRPTAGDSSVGRKPIVDDSSVGQKPIVDALSVDRKRSVVDQKRWQVGFVMLQMRVDRIQAREHQTHLSLKHRH